MEMGDPDSPSDFQGLGITGGTFSESFINQYPLDSNVPYRTILFIILFTVSWTLALTFVPVFVTLPPDNYYAHHPNWFSGNDFMRFVEPVGGLPLNFLVFYKSGIFRHMNAHENVLCLFIFLFGAALYEQGSGYHSAANMFKNALETIMTDDDTAPNSREYENLYYYMRTVWQHIVAHYIYAAGYAIMNFAQVYAYRDVKAPQLGLTRNGKILLTLSSLAYGVLIAGVAINFPSGLIVGLLYTVLYGICGIGGYIYIQYRIVGDKSIIGFGNRPVVHHFFFGNLWGFCLIIAWIGYTGGLVTRSQQAN